jgi:hypothetical protein
MYHSIQLTNLSPSVRPSLNRWPWRRDIVVIPLVLASFALSPLALAVDPPPDGGYPNQNTAEGEDALFSLTAGSDNTAIGFHALFSNTTGSYNTATGFLALLYNTTGILNTANGVRALASNTTGFQNTANGVEALLYNTTGYENTANGVDALANNTSGNGNTANGSFALASNSTGGQNTANGADALVYNTSGSQNTANAAQALVSNTTGSSNTASGWGALFSNGTGDSNTADGAYALFNTTGSNNIALGTSAGYSLTTGNNNIDIGNPGLAGESGRIRIGTAGTQTATFIAGIRDTPLTHGPAVVVGITADGQLGVIKVSSARFKEVVKPMDKASEAIFSLQPVTFRYKKDPGAVPQFGLVAEEVAKVNPDLVVRDMDGKPFTVRYEEINAMLLNEFLKEHRKVAQLEATVVGQQQDFQKQVQALTARLNAQESQLTRVSEQVQESKAALQLVADSQ